MLAALILVLGVSAILSMPTDIFPEINIPVVTVIWQETGLSTPEMEQRVTTYSQYSISTSVNGIRDIEAQTLNGISIQKLYFQPDVDIDLAIAQIVAATTTNSIRALMPPGIQPPTIVRYDASSVSVLQISLSSDTLNGAQLYDYGIYRMRQQLAPIHGVTLPTPAGGKYRQIMVDIDPLKLQAKGLTPNDVVNAVNAQAFTVPSGTAKLGDKQYTVRTNALPSSIDDLNNIPIKFVNNATVFIKDVGQVHDGWLVQQNVVRTEGGVQFKALITSLGQEWLRSLFTLCARRASPLAAAPGWSTCGSIARLHRLSWGSRLGRLLKSLGWAAESRKYRGVASQAGQLSADRRSPELGGGFQRRRLCRASEPLAMTGCGGRRHRRRLLSGVDRIT